MSNALPHEFPEPGQSEIRNCDVETLATICREVLTSLGVDEPRAQRASELLTMADLRGIDSHGVARLWVYTRWLEEGHAKANPRISIIRESASTIAMHGDNGLGVVVGPEANDRVIAKAAEAGSAWGTISHSNHFGIAGYYALQAVQQEMIGMVFSNATAQVFPVGSTMPMLGTNPIAVAFPTGRHQPIVMDMATSTSAFGKIEVAMRQGQTIPEGWVVSNEGEALTDPTQIFRQSHSLSPLGATPAHAVHKGYCLASLADLMGGVLSGAAWGPHCPHFFFPERPHSEQTANGLGQAFSAIRVDALHDLDSYRERIDAWIDAFHAAPPLREDTPVLVPGEPEWKTMNVRRREGIPLTKIVFEQLQQLGRRVGIELDR